MAKTPTKENYQKVKEWRNKNPDKLRQQKERYRERNKEKINSYWRDWYKKKQEERIKDLEQDQ